MQPLQELLSELIDYAGLFPPAALEMSPVSENFNAYSLAQHQWMLARLVVPLGRLDEFVSAWSGQETVKPRISLLTPPLDASEFSDAVDQIVQFNARALPHTIDAVEVRVTDTANVANALKLPADVACFIEVPAASPADAIRGIAELQQPSRLFGKIRTGGVKPEMIPDAAYVARFMHSCLDAGIGFKATAGLHHPFRAEYPLTYEAGCDVGRMHGFMNVFLGACLLYKHRLSEAELTEFLDSAGADDLKITNEEIQWRGYGLHAADIKAARDEFITSFGSCSFTEPIEDLTRMSLLPENPHATH